jgi:hypothetical protein
MSHHQIAGQNHNIKIYRSFKNVIWLKYLGTTVRISKFDSRENEEEEIEFG